MPVIASAATALPEHRYAQADITEAFADLMVGRGPDGHLRDVIRRTHQATTVRNRHLVLPLEEYTPLDDFGKANDVFLREAPLLAARAASAALQAAGGKPASRVFDSSQAKTARLYQSITAKR